MAIIAPSPIDALEWGVKRELIEHDMYLYSTNENMIFDGRRYKAFEKELMGNPYLRSDQLNQATSSVTSHPDFVSRIRDAVVSTFLACISFL